MRVMRSVAVALGLALVTAACGSDDGDDESASDAPGTTAAQPSEEEAESAGECTEERRGGEITMGVGTLLARGLDPTVALGTGQAGATELAALFDTLMRYDPETGEFVPHVAESVESNEDLTEWTLTLQEGVTFGNGDPLTAEAVRFSIERLAESTVQAAGEAQQVTSMEVVDDLTIVFNFDAPMGGFPYMMASEAGMVVNPAVVEAMGEEFANNPLGGGVGPYEVERFDPEVEIVLTAKDDYWGGPVCIETLRFTQVSGSRGTYEAFQQQELDVMIIQDADVVVEAKDAGVEGFSTFAAGGAAIVFNSGRTDDPVMGDVRLRQAVAHAIDVELMTERVFGEGFGFPNSGLTDPSHTIYTGISGLEYDPEAAAALVEEAKADGFDGNISLACADRPDTLEQGLVAEAMLEAVGFNVTVENPPQAEINRRLIDGNYEVMCAAQSLFPEAITRAMGRYRTDSPRNRAGFSDPDMDAAIDEINAADTVEETTEAMRGLSELFNELVPAVPLWSEEWFVGHQPEVQGLVMSREGQIMFHDAWVEQ